MLFHLSISLIIKCFHNGNSANVDAPDEATDDDKLAFMLFFLE